jgi:hypothetical protein
MNEELQKALGLGPRRQPTDETLRHAWKCWHFLGEESDHHKAQVLFTTSTYMWPPDLVAASKRFKEQYGAFLDPIIYETSVDLIRVWESMQTSYETSQRLHSKLIESNLRWEHLDNQTPGRVALVRAFRHVRLTEELDPQAHCPDVKTIRRLRRLSDDYRAAHDQAMGLLMDIAFPTPLRTRRFRIVKDVQYDKTPDNHPRGFGTPRSVPWEVEIAQLVALKRVSPEALREFMSERFLSLDEDDQNLFIKRIHTEPRRARQKCGTVAPWLADNAPLLRLLKNQWHDVELLVHDLFLPQHRPAVLRTFASKHGIRLGFVPGGNLVNHQGVPLDLIRPLLTAAMALP